MEKKVSLETIYIPSKDVIFREVEGNLIIVPTADGIGDWENEPLLLNVTGKAIWDRLDGRKNLKKVAEELSKAFEAPQKVIEKDVKEFVEGLLEKKALIEV